MAGERGVEPALGGEDGLGDRGRVRGEIGRRFRRRRRFGREEALPGGFPALAATVGWGSGDWPGSASGASPTGEGRSGWMLATVGGKGRARYRPGARRRGAHLTCQTSEPPSMTSCRQADPGDAAARASRAWR